MVPYYTRKTTHSNYYNIYEEGTVCYTVSHYDDDDETYVMDSWGPGEPKKEKWFPDDEFKDKLRKKEWRREQFK